ncbi:hypothetical protein [Paenibacillus sp. D51F]
MEEAVVLPIEEEDAGAGKCRLPGISPSAASVPETRSIVNEMKAVMIDSCGFFRLSYRGRQHDAHHGRSLPALYIYATMETIAS